MEVKITKIVGDLKYGWFSTIHFKMDGEDYVLHVGGDYTIVTRLYKGRMKCHLECLRGCYGMPKDLIRFKRKRGCYKYIDTEHFIARLIECGLLEK